MKYANLLALGLFLTGCRVQYLGYEAELDREHLMLRHSTQMGHHIAAALLVRIRDNPEHSVYIAGSYELGKERFRGFANFDLYKNLKPKNILPPGYPPNIYSDGR